ncbi:MAG TPA: hypothetical protein VF008_30785 [Niastella sp.]
MKKIMLMMVIALVSMTSFRAAAQPPTQAFGVNFSGWTSSPAGYGVEIKSLNIGISTSQPPGLFLPPATFTNTGNFAQPQGLFILGGFWVAPSLATPLTISIGPGYTARVKNIWPEASTTVRLSVRIANPNGSGNPTVIYGPPVTIAAQAEAILTVPTFAATFTSSPLPTLYDDPNYRVPIAIHILN